jgi:hypothetical protein
MYHEEYFFSESEKLYPKACWRWKFKFCPNKQIERVKAELKRKGKGSGNRLHVKKTEDQKWQ